MKSIFVTTCCLFLSLLTFAQSVTLYADCDYRGTSQTLRVGRYSLSTTRIGAFNLSSIKVPYGLKAIIYNGSDPGTGNRKTTIENDVNCLRDLGWNDNAASIVIEYTNGSGGNYNNNNYNNYDNSNNYPNRYDNYNSGSGPVTIYDDCNYGGRSYRLSLGYHRDNELGIGNDKLSSIRVPSGYKVTLYENDNFQGATKVINYDNACVGKDWNDRTSSILVERNYSNNNNYNYNYNNSYNNKKPSSNSNSYGDVVVIYRDCNYQGDSQPLSQGYHRAGDLRIGNDAISSISVPRGWQVTLYYDDNFSGRSMMISWSSDCLSRDWNDKVSSLYISRTGL